MKLESYAVLVVDDEETIRRLLQKELANSRRTIFTAKDGASALAQLRSHWFDVILLDLRLPDVFDLSLLIQVRESVPHAEVIMITGHGDVDSAVEAMKMGAYDFIRKPFHLDRLDLLVERAHQRVRLARENDRLRHGVDSESSTPFIGHSREIANIQFLIDKVAPARIPVLITGDSGWVRMSWPRPSTGAPCWLPIPWWSKTVRPCKRNWPVVNCLAISGGFHWS